MRRAGHTGESCRGAGRAGGAIGHRATCALGEGHLPDLASAASGPVDRLIVHDDDVAIGCRPLRSLDAGSHAGLRFAGEPVPAYPETLEALRGSGATLVLDIKQGAVLDNERIVRLTEQHGAAPGVIVGARSITDLLDFKRLNPSLRSLGLVPGSGSGPPDPAAIEEFARAGADIIRL